MAVVFLFVAILLLHGLIHLMGPAKAFGVADLPQLTQPITPGMGVLWLVAALLMLATGAAIWLVPRWWWLVGLTAVVVSQAAIAGAWTDAKAGTIANVIVLSGVVFGYLAWGPSSLRARYHDDVDRGLSRVAHPGVVTDADLAHLPGSVAEYVRASGAVGQPRVRSMRARMHGRIRAGASDAWMPFRAEQYNFYDQPSRFFYMNASKMAVPIQGYHRFADREASMLVKLAAVLPVARASGADMTKAETVTLFNDMCLLAPATLTDPAIGWESIDTRTVRATFTHAEQTIRADLRFNDRAELVDFTSDDRGQASADGTTLRAVRWSTPFGEYRRFGPHRLGSHGEGRWHDTGGEYAYIEITIDDISFNVPAR
jgi:hypothetical protein